MVHDKSWEEDKEEDQSGQEGLCDGNECITDPNNVIIVIGDVFVDIIAGPMTTLPSHWGRDYPLSSSSPSSISLFPGGSALNTSSHLSYLLSFLDRVLESHVNTQKLPKDQTTISQENENDEKRERWGVEIHGVRGSDDLGSMILLPHLSSLSIPTHHLVSLEGPTPSTIVLSSPQDRSFIR